jgi:hypothetical protein
MEGFHSCFLEEAMNRRIILTAVAAALAAGTLAARAEERVYRIESDEAHRIAPAPGWNVAAADGMCRLRLWVDDRARVKLHGDQIVVETHSGKRSFDEGSVCTQPLPAAAVDNFHVVVERGRGTVMEVRGPDRRNDYTGAVSIVDPQNGGDNYEVVMAWHNPGVVVGAAPAPLVVPAPAPVPGPEYTLFDEARACQDQVRAKFLQKNPDGDAYVEFGGAPAREAVSAARERIRGDAWARNRTESRPITYECRIDRNDRRVVSAYYDGRGGSRLSSLQ